MKKLLSVLTACVLLACGALIPSVSRAETMLEKLRDLLGGNTSESADPPLSLWNGEGFFSASEVPQEALDGQNNLCCAMTPDGKKLLICGGMDPYLWDLETHQRTALFLGDQKSREDVRAMLARAEGNVDASSLADEELLGVYLRDMRNMGGRASSLRPYMAVNVPGDYLRLNDNAAGMVWLLNGATGALYCRAQGMAAAVYQDTLLVEPFPPSAVVTLENLTTGEETGLDFSSCGGFESGAAMKAATFLPDGSVCAVLRDIRLDAKNGEACVLAVRDPKGRIETYPLGKIRLGQEPDIILSVGSDQIVLASRIHAARLFPYLIDRKSGEVCQIAWQEGALRAAPLESLLDDQGAVVQMEGNSLLPLAPCTDGQSLFVYSMDGYLLLLRPGERAAQYILGSAEAAGMPVPMYFSGNGYDRLLIVTARGDTQLVQLTVP